MKGATDLNMLKEALGMSIDHSLGEKERERERWREGKKVHTVCKRGERSH